MVLSHGTVVTSPASTTSGDPLRLVIALGGNALLRRGGAGTIEEQQAHVEAVMAPVAALAAAGHDIFITHGNGPVVGNIVVRNEAARDQVTPMPLFVDGADSQGGIGFLLQMVLGNALRDAGVDRQVVTVVTQVVVDPADPAFHRPTKPIGPFYTEHEAEQLIRVQKWFFHEESDGTFRRVVPSPVPLDIVEADVIRRLGESGTIVIAAGGGGVPVVRDDQGRLSGVDAVIDKDHTGALLADEIGADLLVMLMEAEHICLGWGTEHEHPLKRVSVTALRAHIAEGAFAVGSMLPKAEAAASFVEASGHDAIVCRADDLASALAGAAGTRVTR
jgi:carbamate kinase